jgi:hypothetical protein
LGAVGAVLDAAGVVRAVGVAAVGVVEVLLTP